MRSASRLADIAPFHVMELLTRAKQLEAAGRDIIHMEVGEPDFPTPATIVEAAQRAIAGGRMFYTPALGLPELREAISRFYAGRYQVAVPASRIVVTAGASGALTLALACLVEPGSEWLLTDPGYPCNRHFIRAFEGVPVSIPVDAASNFQPTTADLERFWSAKTAGALFASPANPTGTMLLPSELAALAAYCEAERIQLISDEIYHGIEYAPLAGGDRLARSAWETSREAVVFSSFSKYFSMTGWRIGWMLVPDRLRRATDVLTGNFTICPPVLAQHACLAAFDDASYAELDGHVRRYADNRALLLDGLPRLGITRLAPADGAFYVYADVGHLTDDTMAFCHDVLARTGVAMAPGIDFDTVDGGRFVRLSFAGQGPVIEAALERLSTVVDR